MNKILFIFIFIITASICNAQKYEHILLKDSLKVFEKRINYFSESITQEQLPGKTGNNVFIKSNYYYSQISAPEINSFYTKETIHNITNEKSIALPWICFFKGDYK